MTTKREKDRSARSGASDAEREAWGRRVRPVVFAPAYREHTEGLLGSLRRSRSRPPVSKLPDWRFNELVEFAERLIAEAREIEPSMGTNPLAAEVYKSRCDAARQAMRTAYDEPLARGGLKHSETQAKRRKDKPGVDALDDISRNDRIRAMHARLAGAGYRDATAQVAAEFELSASQVRRIVKRA